VEFCIGIIDGTDVRRIVTSHYYKDNYLVD